MKRSPILDPTLSFLPREYNLQLQFLCKGQYRLAAHPLQKLKSEEHEEVLDVANVLKFGYFPLFFKILGSLVIIVPWEAQEVGGIFANPTASFFFID